MTLPRVPCYVQEWEGGTGLMGLPLSLPTVSEGGMVTSEHKRCGKGSSRKENTCRGIHAAH